MKVDKPWGWYYTLTPEQTALFRGYLVKELHIKQGHRLSLQRHQHRSEHWIVVNGEGLFECDGRTQLVNEGTHLYIPKGSVHRLTARDQDIRIVEVQCGEIISEDDIQRLEDDYNRKQMNELQKAFLRGCCITILGFAVTGLVASIFLTPDEPKNKEHFEVIDQYEGCSVVRYTDPTTRWHYFLKCS